MSIPLAPIQPEGPEKAYKKNNNRPSKQRSVLRHLLGRLWPKLISRNVPRTLWSRAFLAIVAPIVIMQLSVTYVFFNMHWETVTERLSEGLVGEIHWVLSAYEEDPSPENLEHIAAQAAKSMQLSIKLLPGHSLPNSERHNLYAPLDRSVEKALSASIDKPFWFDTIRYPGFVDIRIKVKAGIIRIYAPKDRAFVTTGHIFIVWMVLATLILTLVAIAFIRNQVRAIEYLSKAAEAFGRGEDLTNFKPYGASEVRSAALSFLKMKDRIARHIEQRTRLLASVSHDLRTPLTRLQLELAMVGDSPAVERMKGDVVEMSYMIDEFLAFARGAMSDNSEDISLISLLGAIDQAVKRAGYQLEVIPPEQDLIINLRPNAVQRAILNLVLNGFHHAQNVKLGVDEDGLKHGLSLRLNVDDDGPGIEPDHYEEAFTPFSRLDESRNQNIKGVGLGMAIARDTIRAHGGEITLEKSPMGGLRAMIELPLRALT